MSFDGDLDAYLTELILDPCEVGEVKQGKALKEVNTLLDVDLDVICKKYGDVKEKKRKTIGKLVCIPHPTDPLRLTIKKVPKHKTMRVNGQWVV